MFLKAGKNENTDTKHDAFTKMFAEVDKLS